MSATKKIFDFQILYFLYIMYIKIKNTMKYGLIYNYFLKIFIN